MPRLPQPAVFEVQWILVSNFNYDMAVHFMAPRPESCNQAATRTTSSILVLRRTLNLDTLKKSLPFYIDTSTDEYS